jgi:uncharacterized protein with PIN domain
MRFLCDDNLGKLARYLRILGFDTIFFKSISDPDLLRIAAIEERMLITRNNNMSLKTNPYGILMISHDNPLEQLRMAVMKLDLPINPSLLFDRCSRCNALCAIVDKARIAADIFPYIIKSQDIIKQCPGCKRYYWKGSHYRKILDTLKSIIDEKYVSGRWPEL